MRCQTSAAQAEGWRATACKREDLIEMPNPASLSPKGCGELRERSRVIARICSMVFDDPTRNVRDGAEV